MNNINEELKNFRQNVNENLHKILKLDLLTEDDKRRYNDAIQRREIRMSSRHAK